MHKEEWVGRRTSKEKVLQSLKSATPLLKPLPSPVLGFHPTRVGPRQLRSPTTVTETPQCMRALCRVLGASELRKCLA